MPTQEHFQHAPCGARFECCPACEISTFRSGQAEATRIGFGLWVLFVRPVLRGEFPFHRPAEYARAGLDSKCEMVSEGDDENGVVATERDHPGKQKGQALRLAPSSFLDLWLISF